jgi:hypothetical protein
MLRSTASIGALQARNLWWFVVFCPGTPGLPVSKSEHCSHDWDTPKTPTEGEQQMLGFRGRGISLKLNGEWALS